MSRPLFLLAVIAVLATETARGDIIDVANSSQFQAALTAAMPGDEIVLAAGTYPGRFEAISITDVKIRSADPANPAIINAAGVGEGIKMSSVKRVEITDLIIQNAAANGINIDDGNHVAASEDVSLKRLVVRDGAGIGIKLTGVDRFHIDRAQVVNWGASGIAIDLVGSHEGLIERSYMANNAPGSGNGVQAKAGSSNIVIRANRFINANERSIQIGGSTTLSAFRPQPPGDVEASGVVAEGNFIRHNGGNAGTIRAAVSFINVADGMFRNNVVVRPSWYAIRVLKENRSPGFVDTQNGTVSNNIFVWNQGDLFDVVNDGSSTLPNTFHFSGNQWYNATNPGNSTPSLPSPETDGIYGVDPQLDMQGITPWEFSWGKWLVNTSNLPDIYTIAPGENYFLATPGDDSSLDLSLANPLVGNWSLAPLAAGDFTVEAFDYKLLIAPQAGDYDLNGSIDEQDYLVWKSAFGSTEPSTADGNRDGIVDAADYTVWRDQFESIAGSEVADLLRVPEPNTGMLLLLGGLGARWLRVRQHASVQLAP